MEKILNTKLNVFLFYFCYTIMLSSIMFQQVYIIGDFLVKAYQICIIILLFACVINISKMTKEKILILFITVIVAILTRFISGSNILLTICLFTIANRNIKFENIVKYDLKIKTIFLIIVSTLYFLGMTNVNIHYRNGVIRHSMGFSNPNSFSTFVMSIVAEYLYLHKENIRLKDLIITVLAIVIIDYFADSRTQVLCLIVLIVMLIVNKHIKIAFKNQLVKFAISNAFIILTILSIFLVYSYEQKYDYAVIINEQISNRLENPAKMIERIWD